MAPSERMRPRLRIAGLTVRYLCEGVEGVGTLGQISRAGFFVRCDLLPRPGAVVAVQIETDEKGLLDLRGEVRWTTEGLAKPELEVGFGVVLRDPPPGYREFFRLMMERAPEL